MKLAVLNPGGNDPELAFPDFAGAPSEKDHAPVNFHGFAACTGGSFHRRDDRIPSDTGNVLVLIRRDLKAARQALIELRRAGKTVLVSFKETGAAQIASLMDSSSRLKLVREICRRADGALAATPDAVQWLHALGARSVEMIPTPYPLEDERWNFSVPLEERSGILLGTREWDVPSRNHLAALLMLRPLAEAMYEPVTVFNVDGWSGRRRLAGLEYPEGLLRVVEGRRPYPAYLRIMAKHKLVFQLDASAVPGQVAGDALLCRVPCIGGDGAVERIAFGEWCGHGRTFEQLSDMAARFLEHPYDSMEMVDRAMERARGQLGYEAVRRRLGDFLRRVGRS